MNVDIDWPASAVSQARALENRRARSFLIVVLVLAMTIMIGIVFLVYSRTTLLASATLCLCSVMFYRQFRMGQDSRRAMNAVRGKVAIENAIVSRASFDIRNALMALLGYCDLPLENTSGSEDRIASIRSQAVQIVAALDRVLDYPGTNPRPSTSATTPPAPQRPARVLLAEDDPHLLQTIKFYLESSGAEVTVVTDGQLAYKQAMRACEQQQPFDLILMDVQMPKFDGCESTIKLRNAGYLHPIIALTANATDPEQRRCMAAGCNGFLAKPTDRAELLQTVRRFMRASAPSGSAAEAAVSVSPQVAAVRESFRCDVPSRVAEIADAVFANDLPRVSALAHRLKGTAGCYGFKALCESAGDLQSAADRGESTETVYQCLKGLTQQSCPTIPAEAA